LTHIYAAIVSQSAVNRHTVRPRVTISEAVIIQFVLLKMSKVLL